MAERLCAIGTWKDSQIRQGLAYYYYFRFDFLGTLFPRAPNHKLFNRALVR